MPVQVGMSKFIELKDQVRARGNRRWFYSRQIDLIVWMGDDDSLDAFEFYYDKAVDEHVLIWQKGTGFSHLAVEDGEQKPVLNYKQTPILVADGRLDPGRIRRLFEAVIDDLPREIANPVRRELGHMTG
jgi:hypothetical protein